VQFSNKNSSYTQYTISLVKKKTNLTEPITVPNYDEFEKENIISVSNIIAAYSVSKTVKEDGLPQYDSSLAIETLLDGYTIVSLWEVIPSTNN